MNRTFNAGSLVVLLALLHGRPTSAQTADSARLHSPVSPPVFSIGQPPLWQQQLSAQGTALARGGRTGATFSYGVFRAFSKPPIAAFNPLLGLIGGTAEAYGSIGGAEDAGVRAMATSRMFATSVGADWDIRHGRINTIVSWQGAIRRGGILDHGTMVRVDWIPGRGQTIRVGIAAPLFQPLAGRTRQRETTVDIPYPQLDVDVTTIGSRDAATQQLVRDIASASEVIAA